MPLTLRRFLLWTVVCVISAAPSFAVAHNEFHTGAMFAGVGLFICIYTAITSTATFARIYRRPFVRRTMYVGYGLRLLLSIAIPVGLWIDLFPGLLSVGFVQNVLQIDTRSFIGTFLTTCVQGTFLNIILLIFMAVVQAFQRIFLKPPQEVRGFEVIPMAMLAEPKL